MGWNEATLTDDLRGWCGAAGSELIAGWKDQGSTTGKVKAGGSIGPGDDEHNERGGNGLMFL